ncbi:MAG TPA: tRNA lysidine(34) synthetase TilS, partial [Spirochaetia bacterium]|nr:tRNA lysidine(34) synthetase TilS [Spirochaetia bacterium]
MNELETAVSTGVDACSVPRGSALLVAVSGGPDSTALLCALCALREERQLSLSACLVDHGIRPRAEIEEDLGFVVGLCREHGVPLEIAVVPAGQCRDAARAQRRSLEEVAREERQRLLVSAARRAGCAWIALGHTEDDAVETLLMRVIQGSDAAGLAGIPAVRGRFIRPLLSCSRRQVIDYLRSLRQDWREDSSNSDARILRNRIRAALLPVLEREFPGYRSGLLALSAKAGMVSRLLAVEADRMRWRRSRRGFSIPRSRFEHALPAVRAASLMRLSDELR